MIRDSVWTYMRKYRRLHPEASLIQQGQAAEEAGYVRLHPLVTPVAETQFSCYDAVAEKLSQGQTLTLMAIRRLISPYNVALHQDQRFCDLEDGSYYLWDQEVINERLVAHLKSLPERATQVSTFLAEQGGPTKAVLWSQDPRLQIFGDRVQLAVTPEELTPQLLRTAQAWIEDWLQADQDFFVVTEQDHPDLAPIWWNAALRAALQLEERLVAIAPDLWCRPTFIRHAPVLDDLPLIRLDPPEVQTFYPSFPDSPGRQARHCARCTLTVGVAEVHFGYLAIPGLWQPAFNQRYYQAQWQVNQDTVLTLPLWSEGGLLYSEELQLRLLWAGVGLILDLELRANGQLWIKEKGYDPERSQQEGQLFAHEDLQLAQTLGAELWQGLEQQHWTIPELKYRWQEKLGRPLTLKDYRAALRNPHVTHSAQGIGWRALDWEPLLPLMTELALAQEPLEAEPILDDLFAQWDPTPEPDTLDLELIAWAPPEVAEIQTEPELERSPELTLDLAALAEPDEVLPPSVDDLLLKVLVTEPIEDLLPPSSVEDLAAYLPEPTSLADLLEPDPGSEPLLLENLAEPLADLLIPAPGLESAPRENFGEPLVDLLLLPPDALPSLEADLVELDAPDVIVDPEESLGAILAQAIQNAWDELPVAPPPLADLEREPVPADRLTAILALEESLALSDLTESVPAAPKVVHPLYARFEAIRSPSPTPFVRWQSLLRNLINQHPLTPAEQYVVETLWQGEYTANPDLVRLIQARSAGFWRSQLVFTLLPLSGNLSEFREILTTHLDFEGSDPSSALVYLILPALGYIHEDQGWVWQPPAKNR